MSKTPSADRSHGGPGSSHENANKPHAADRKSDSGGHANNPPQPGAATNPSHSQRSGGGGERDRHHMHDPATKS